MAYIVEKECVTTDGGTVWCYEGTWTDPKKLAYACFNMGRMYGEAVTDIRIKEETKNED